MLRVIKIIALLILHAFVDYFFNAGTIFFFFQPTNKRTDRFWYICLTNIDPI